MVGKHNFNCSKCGKSIDTLTDSHTIKQQADVGIELIILCRDCEPVGEVYVNGVLVK